MGGARGQTRQLRLAIACSGGAIRTYLLAELLDGIRVLGRHCGDARSGDASCPLPNRVGCQHAAQAQFDSGESQTLTSKS